jgi:hypothetical protein
MKLLKPSVAHIPEYVAALRQGWSPDNLRPEAAQEQIKSIEKDAKSFVSNLDDPTAKAGPVTLPDGSPTAATSLKPATTVTASRQAQRLQRKPQRRPPH